jgi:hypothetical protein
MRKLFDHGGIKVCGALRVRLNDLASFPHWTDKGDRMAYSKAQSCFEANDVPMISPDAQTTIALNLSKGLSELTASVAADIQELHNQLRALRTELESLKSEKRRMVI